MKEAAASCKDRTGVTVVVKAGPAPQWIDAARGNADVMFSGAENMMTDFVKAMNGAIDEKTIDPLYLRASNILVRPGNPHHIGGLRDLLRPGFTVMVRWDERRVGKECARTCKSLWSPFHEKKKDR